MSNVGDVAPTHERIRMRQYLDLLRHVLEHGAEKSDRTGTGTGSVFGWQMRFDLNEGFPLLSTKKLHLRSRVHELLRILNAVTNTADLKNNKVAIWSESADAHGGRGRVHCKPGRRWATDDGGESSTILWLVTAIRRK